MSVQQVNAWGLVEGSVQPKLFGFQTWRMEDFGEYVSSELTNFVARDTVDIYFIRVSKKCMICVLTLRNGFDVRGESACIDPSTYDPAIGAKYALHNAVDKASVVIAYMEQQKRHEGLAFERDKPAPKE